jgi:hypothetical protein
MARVRVHARVGQEGKVPMVGLLPRAALAEIRRRMGEARRKAGGQCHLEAVPQSAEKVRVIVPPATEAQEGWRVVLRLRVREGEEPAPQHLRSRVRVELEDLVREAELVAETSG